MYFENIIETFIFDLVLEGIGTIFAFGLLWHFLFQNGLQMILILFITSIC